MEDNIDMNDNRESIKVRELTGHRVNLANDTLTITVEDAPGAGGANHLYVIRGFNTNSNPSCLSYAKNGEVVTDISVLFQNGPIGEVGVNGVTQEALLAILIDRLECFQAGEYACDENKRALDSLIEAQAHLKSRTAGRMARGVEGTHEK